MCISDPALQLQRLVARDGTTEEDARNRLSAQMPIGSKAAFADIAIDNNGDTEALRSHVVKLARLLDKKAGKAWRVSWLVPPVALLFALFSILRRQLYGPARRVIKES